MKKRLLACFLAVCMLVSFTAISACAEEPPINQMPDYKSLTEAQPGIKLNDVPEGSTDVSYGWLNNIPAIDQIDFTYDGHSYCFRAAACPAGSTSLDISGVNEQFPAFSTVEVSGENQAGGSYVLRYDAKSGKGVANWASEMAETQYSLYSEDACLGEVKEMPFVKVMEKLFIYDQGAKTVSGTVLDTADNTLALNLTDGSSVVLNCEHIKSITVKNGDAVDVYYLGEINGDADVVRIVPSDGDSTAPAGNTFSGSIFRYIDNLIYVMTDDENVFSFEITPSTVVSGAASTIAENEDVVVTFDGELYTDPYVPPVAREVNVTYVGVAPTPEPVPTAGPTYVDRNIDGIVTSACGIWITVNGISFEVNSANCYVSGRATVGGYASINFRDYGNYKVVTSAYFADLPIPTPAPQRQAAGNAYNYTGSSVDIGGQRFYINRGTTISGRFVDGCYTEVTYNANTFEATYIQFYAPTPTPTPAPVQRQAAGNAYNYTGSSVDIGGQRFYITGNTTISGYFVEGCYTEVTYLSGPGVSEAIYIIFYAPAPTPTPIPTDPPIVGPAGAGWTCPNCGIRNGVQASFCANCGSPRPDTAAEHATGFVGGVIHP